jgi:hypothetical protein
MVSSSLAACHNSGFQQYSCLKNNFGDGIFNPSFSIHIVHLFVRLQPSMSSKPTPFSTSTWKGKMTVSYFSSTVTAPLSNFFHPQELEPRRQRSDPAELFVNLGATLEDHGEVMLARQLGVLCLIYPSVQTGNEKDVTMRAGRQKGALPLIRKFNEHSERLLNSAL